MSENVKYYLAENGEFIIENFDLAKPFSSFFPGIAGVWGMPLWVFYVNRGQAIASFGIKDKDHPIMEYFPANKSYYLVPELGFRTFIKVKKGKKVFIYDAFQRRGGFDTANKMMISPHGLRLSEINRTLGIEVDVEYFPIPNENYGALARTVTIKNISRSPAGIELLDGMPQIVPYGMHNWFLKEMSRTIEAWVDVENLENEIPFLRLKVDASDRPEVVHIKEGNFYISFDKKGLIKPIVDPETIFSSRMDLSSPAAFAEKSVYAYPKKQLTRSRMPCCMAFSKQALKPQSSYTIFSLIGNMSSLDKLKKDSSRIANPAYFEERKRENAKVIRNLASAAFTNSALKNFDLYCAQNFLDNVMRGGYPFSVERASGNTNIQVFSRKHGDLERDYNRYLLESSYFSQGNGNFRDANQNRRSDAWFNPKINDENVMAFFNLLQADGYNPLVIKPDSFFVDGNAEAVSGFFNAEDKPKVMDFLKKSFTPGELFYFLEQNNIYLIGRKMDLLKVLLDNSSRQAEAEHGEGFWIDHWHYCLDILESYLSLYPENLGHILIDKKEFTFFDNAHKVRPRCEKYILKGGSVFQYGSVVHDDKKASMIKQRTSAPNVARAQKGLGASFKTTLAVKMLSVIANKFASLDPFGIGIEMEADKPSWCDSINGLPALLGSSSCETLALKRWIIFLKDGLGKLCLGDKYALELPVELHEFLLSLKKACSEKLDSYQLWEKRQAAKEAFRAKVFMGFDGAEKKLELKELYGILGMLLRKTDEGIKKAYNKKAGLYNTYFINEVIQYKPADKDEKNHVKALKFRQRPVPLFLEAIVHGLRVPEKPSEAARVFKAVRKSPLYDKKLKMYKVCAPLEEMPEEIGRMRIFTPGWLENESIWLHMEYKYLLELLKNGLYSEFFEDLKNTLVPFLPAERYGRSILENSSFLVSSAFCDESLHGNGFVARLSGSTAEFINMWLIMCAGARPFSLDKERSLRLEFKPILPSWLFTKEPANGFEKNTFAFKFLGKTLVVYHNPKRKDTFGKNCAKIKEIRLKAPGSSKETVISSPIIPSPYSNQIRENRFSRIDVFLS